MPYYKQLLRSSEAYLELDIAFGREDEERSSVPTYSALFWPWPNDSMGNEFGCGRAFLSPFNTLTPSELADVLGKTTWI